MPERTPDAEAGTGSAPPSELCWRCHPARQRPMRTVLVLAVLLGLLYFTAWYTGSPAVGLILTLVVFLSLGAYFFPTRYTLNERGISVRTVANRMERPWSAYRSHWPDTHGVLLSPFPGASRLENFRGLFIRFENNREDVLQFVRRFVPRGLS